MVDWSVSPRIIEIAIPSHELLLQDLYDTLRILAFENIGEPEIVDASGKEFLSEYLSIGLTVKLLNAKIKFEDRTSPPYVECNILGGNLIAVDEYGYSMSPIEPSAYVTVSKTNSSSATIITGATEENINKIKRILSGRWD